MNQPIHDSLEALRSVDQRQVAGRPRTAFVLSGGASLGALQVGRLRALYEHGIVVNNTPISHAVELGAERIYVLPTMQGDSQALDFGHASRLIHDGLASARSALSPVGTRNEAAA
jgi:predicted acylesterase/phospholipase RssA